MWALPSTATPVTMRQPLPQAASRGGARSWTSQRNAFAGRSRRRSLATGCGNIGHAVQSCAESYGFAVVRDYVGHGVGRKLHEDPAVPNYGTQGHGLKLLPGMTLAIEPMINIKGSAVVVRPDGTVLTKSGSLSAHFEHTVAITASGPVILTR